MTEQLTASHLGLPPPAQWTLYDADRAVGWTTERSVGFHGFADQTEAVHAAWVAYRALARRLARDEGRRAVPIDTEPLSVRRDGDRELIVAGGRAIATLVRPGEQSPTGSASFGFEVEISPPADELRVRSLARLMYRTLRRSGLRWALWRPVAPGGRPTALEQASIAGKAGETSRPGGVAWLKPLRPSTWIALGLASLSLLVLALLVPKGLGVGLTVAGLVALVVFSVAAMTGRRLPHRLIRVWETES